MKTRKVIELLKEDVRITLEHDAVVYKRAIIREIDSLWRGYNLQTTQPSIERFAEYVFHFLKIPRSYRLTILADLQETQKQIASVWDDYFKKELTSNYKAVDYEKLIAAHSVDFPSIDKGIRDQAVKAFRESVNKNYSFETIRTNLQKTTIGTNQIYTLANTSVSMFDNSAMFEHALSAGINEFKYDGTLQPNSRIFCVEHFQKIYTYAEILQMNNGQGVPVVSSCGGYNCHHYWTAFIAKILGRK